MAGSRKSHCMMNSLNDVINNKRRVEECGVANCTVMCCN
jgi:hypothetical protein